MKKVKFKSAFPNGIPGLVRRYYFENIAIEQEINTGLNFYGEAFIYLPLHAASAKIHLNLTSGSSINTVISDPRSIVSVVPGESYRISFYRKEDYGPIFITNKSPYKQSLVIYFFEP